MLASDSGATQNLTQEELVLHHFAATINNNIEAYRESPSRHDPIWRGLWGVTFRMLLVFLLQSTAIFIAQIDLGKINELLLRHQEPKSFSSRSPTIVEPHRGLQRV
jgi:hypothetical protein